MASKENQRIHHRVVWFVFVNFSLTELFSIELHHGGEISYDMYVGGKVTYIDNCDKYLMSLPVIDDMVEVVGYIERFMNYYFKIPNMDLSNVDDCCTSEEGNGQKEKNCEGPEKSKGKFMAEVGEGDVGEGDIEVFFDIPIKATEEDDSDFEESEYGSDVDNPVFSKFDERDSVQRSARQSEQSREKEEEQMEEEIDTANVEQNVVDDPDYNSDALESFNEKTDMKDPTLTLGLVFRAYVQFKRAVIMYSLMNGYGEIHFPRNEKLKVVAKYAKGCPWKCYAGKMIKLNPTWPVDSFLATVESEWNHGCTKRKAYRALDRALDMWCRPLIGLDGCHLKSVYEGQLLCAVGINPNDETWVIAYAVVEMENKSSWIWFLELLAVDVGIVNQGGWTFISDLNLFKGKTLKDALWSVAKTTTFPYFKKAMEDLKKLNEKAYDWLVKLPAHHWSKSYFETHPKCDMLLNNLCESFNAVILIPRQKPIVATLLLIHTLLMKRIQMRRDIMANKVGDLCPKIKKKLEEAKIQSGRCIAQWSGNSKFQVDAGRGEQYVVDLVEKTCSCRKQPGRPRKKRNKEAAEKDNEGEQTSTNPTNNPQGPPQPLKLGRKGQGTLKCIICKKEGHNARTNHRHLPPRDKQASTSAQGQTAPKKRTRKTKVKT
ncbi:hypothetical protein D8674_017671 [Pyrus ussuriensis x Pyrus communis]|uniref:MULE transposase domain-containing protein n=1 Tax=Pyrus ussuriensis x Pyrus communis TaxID=2448454 RepID=A0A5N5HII4_9ROSA|nr:hypothetical protein D8674_017671 [Pyrus ussuriensis x Pyrus communis]